MPKVKKNNNADNDFRAYNAQELGYKVNFRNRYTNFLFAELSAIGISI